MAESKVIKDLLLEASKKGWRLFRNNTATGWVSSVNKIIRAPMPISVRLEPGDLVVRKAIPLHAGLCKGSSDLIGWKIVDITQDMVGRKVAIFTAIEAKYGTTRTTEEQANFIDNVNRSGGYGKVVWSAEEL